MLKQLFTIAYLFDFRVLGEFEKMKPSNGLIQISPTAPLNTSLNNKFTM